MELVQYLNNESRSLKNPKIDGINIIKLKENMLNRNSLSIEDVNRIFGNANEILKYIIDPDYCEEKNVKILCLGKVQSGKTSFFTSVIALAFDNGYNLVYLLGGTKNKLKKQNIERLKKEFCNNGKVKIIDLVELDENITKLIKSGYKIILVSLKNASTNTNLGLLESYSYLLKDIPSIVIDDEGDECSPGAPKSKSKNAKAGRTHDYISNIISNIKICNFLSVTATPQANFLISTIDELSPDYCVLIYPGEKYTGGNSFHDVYSNPHVIDIKDENDFKTTIPNSFKKAFLFFIFSCIDLKTSGNGLPFSMLIHPSSLTKIQSMIREKVQNYYSYIFEKLRNPNSLEFENIYNEIFEIGNAELSKYDSYEEFKIKTQQNLNFVLNNIHLYEYNISENGRENIRMEENEKFLYKIYVGGNMLGRGLTIENLIVTYIYRDSKISQIDTMYQRARWFGYKKDYFDYCKVYMTSELKNKFIDIVDNENDMWDSLESFLLTKNNIKNFPRLFRLNNDKLRLTRNTISKTVEVERVNPGYTYDKSIMFSESDIKNNRELVIQYLKSNENFGKDIQFGNSDIQHHFVIETKFSDFYNDFISHYKFPKGSKFGLLSFTKILNQINESAIEDKISIVYMRYKTGEFRSTISNGMSIKELPQSYDNNTNYPGDKSLSGLNKRMHIQIHFVYTSKDKKSEIIPLLAFNNPITKSSIIYVTGDNYYGN